MEAFGKTHEPVIEHAAVKNVPLSHRYVRIENGRVGANDDDRGATALGLFGGPTGRCGDKHSHGSDQGPGPSLPASTRHFSQVLLKSEPPGWPGSAPSHWSESSGLHPRLIQAWRA